MSGVDLQPGQEFTAGLPRPLAHLPMAVFRIGRPTMPIFFFCVRHGEDAQVSSDGADFPDRNTAWKELTGVCSDIVGEVSRTLGENAEWQMELLDESKKPVFRIRLVAETLEDADEEPRPGD